jgi:predicted nuclease with TOPRIM domain
MSKLYQLADQYLKFNEFVENALDSDGLTEDDLQMFVDTLDSIQDELEGKVENIAKFLKNIEGDIKAYKSEEERLEKKRKYLTNKFDGLKAYTLNMLEMAKIEKVKAGTFNVRLQKNNPSVFYIDETLIPAIYKTPQPDKISGTDILNDLKSGIVVAGARIADEKKHIRFS